MQNGQPGSRSGPSASTSLPAPPPPSLHHPKPLVLSSHLEEVSQPLLEHRAPVPRGSDPADADPLVGFRKPLKVLPGGRIPLEALADVGRQQPLRLPLGVFPPVEHVLDPFETGLGHPPGCDQPPHALAVHRGEPTGGPARGEALGIAVAIDRFQDAVDPAVAQRLLHRVVVRDTRLAAVLLVIDQPDLGRRLVVAREPRPPLAAILRVEGLAELHSAGVSPFFSLFLKNQKASSTSPTTSATLTARNNRRMKKNEPSFQSAKPARPTAASCRIGLNMGGAPE